MEFYRNIYYLASDFIIVAGYQFSTDQIHRKLQFLKSSKIHAASPQTLRMYKANKILFLCIYYT